MFFVVEKAKQKHLFENCKWFFKKEKINSKSLVLLEGVPSPPDYWPCFMSVNFENFFDQW